MSDFDAIELDLDLDLDFDVAADLSHCLLIEEQEAYDDEEFGLELFVAGEIAY